MTNNELTAAVGADKLQPDCSLSLTRAPVEDDVPVIIIINGFGSDRSSRFSSGLKAVF